MNISGTQGLQAAQSGLTQATIDVARPTQNQATQTESERPVEETDKTEALVSAIESQQQGEASARVIEAGSQTVGSLIDITA